MAVHATTSPIFDNYDEFDLDADLPGFGSEYSDLSPQLNPSSDTLRSKYFDNTLLNPQHINTDVKYATNDNLNIYVDVTPGLAVAESSFSKVASHMPEGLYILYSTRCKKSCHMVSFNYLS